MTYAEAKETKNNYNNKQVNFMMCGENVAGVITETKVMCIGGQYEIDCTIQKAKGKEWLTVKELIMLNAF